MWERRHLILAFSLGFLDEASKTYSFTPPLPIFSDFILRAFRWMYFPIKAVKVKWKLGSLTLLHQMHNDQVQEMVTKTVKTPKQNS